MVSFTAKILSWRFRQLNIVGCLLKRRPTKGGGAPQDPPSYTPVFFWGQGNALLVTSLPSSSYMAHLKNYAD